MPSLLLWHFLLHSFYCTPGYIVVHIQFIKKTFPTHSLFFRPSVNSRFSLKKANKRNYGLAIETTFKFISFEKSSWQKKRCVDWFTRIALMR